MKYGCVLLAGGRGRRMGEVNKAKLEYGNRTFAGRIAGEMEKTGLPCYMSAAVYEQIVPRGWTLVRDVITDAGGGYIGPAGGIYSCLKQAETDGLEGLFFVPCDAPFFSREIIDKLAVVLDEKTEAACWRTADGRIQTTFGWYSVKMLPMLEKEIDNGKYKLIKCLEKVRCTVISTSTADIEDRFFMNINSEEDYRDFEKKSLYERNDDNR